MKKYISLENLSRFYTKLKGTTLDTMEEIQANQTSGKIAGALAVKELNSSLSERETILDYTNILFPANIGRVINTEKDVRKFKKIQIIIRLGGQHLTSFYFNIDEIKKWDNIGYNLQCNVYESANYSIMIRIGFIENNKIKIGSLNLIGYPTMEIKIVGYKYY